MKKILATLACALIASSTAFAGEYPDISITELKEKIEAKEVTVIDVNGTRSYEAAHVPSAIDFASNKDELAKLLPEDKGALIVAYCGGPSCSAYQRAANAAKEMGYTNIKHMSAGMSGWLAAKESVEKVDKKG